MHEIDQGQLLASIAATSNDCILSVDVNGTIVWASPATEQVLGWAPTDLAGKDIGLVETDEGVRLHAEYLQRLQRGERVAPFRSTGVRRDGSTFSAEVTLGPANDAAGVVVGVTVILRDVTAEVDEQRELELALEMSRAHFEQMPTPHALLTLAGRLVSVNPAWCELFGHEEEWFEGADVLDLVHPMDVANARERLEVLRRGSAESLSYQGVFRDAEQRSLWLLVDATLLREQDDAPSAIAVSARDLTVVDEARRVLALQETLFESLGHRAWDTAVVMDENLQITYASPSVAQMLGYSPEEVTDRIGLEYVHPSDFDLLSERIERVMARTRHTEVFRLRLRDSRGQWRWVEETLHNCLHDPAIRGLVANLRDVTDQVQTEEALRVSEALHRAMVETAQEGIMAMAPDGTTLFANETVVQLLGLSLEAIIGADTLGLFGLTALQASNAAGEPVVCEVSYQHPDGRELILEVQRSPLAGAPDASSLGSLVMVSDVTAARHTERVLRRQALHDPLTGLPNRYLFQDRLDMARARLERTAEGRAALLFVDLDDLKPINDSHGHDAGDRLLQTVATRLVASVRGTDTVGRLGGDEFAIICEDTDAAGARLVAERILEAVREPVDLDGHALTPRLSIGVALTPPHSFDDLLRRADEAMYAAKQAGGGRIALAEE